MSAVNPTTTLPLFAPPSLVRAETPFLATFSTQLTGATTVSSARRFTPTEKGEAGAEDAHQHARDHAPGWLLQALGDALLACRDLDGGFTSETIRLAAEAKSEALKAWLEVKGRDACYGGWWRSRIRLHKLVRVARPPAVAQRASRRGAVLPWWRFPEGP